MARYDRRIEQAHSHEDAHKVMLDEQKQRLQAEHGYWDRRVRRLKFNDNDPVGLARAKVQRDQYFEALSNLAQDERKEEAAA